MVKFWQRTMGQRPLHVKLVVVLAALSVLSAGFFAWRFLYQNPVNSAPKQDVSQIKKNRILSDLRQSPPPLTDAQKAAILKDLQK